VMSRDELIRAFTLEGISGGDAVFNPDKLDWFNTQYVAKLAPDDLVAKIKPLLETAGLWRQELDGEKRAWLERVLKLAQPRVRRLPDFVEQTRPFLAERVEYDVEAVRKHLTTAGLQQHIEALAASLENLQPWDEVTIERELREVADERKIKAAVLIHAARIATTGKAVSPGIFEVLALMGQRVTVTRLAALAEFLRAS
jgi:glutamyl/glutaminyl-tRNA synthetase